MAHEERTEITEIDAAAVDERGRRQRRRRRSTIVGVDGADEVTVRAHISDGLRATGHEIDRPRRDAVRARRRARCSAPSGARSTTRSRCRPTCTSTSRRSTTASPCPTDVTAVCTAHSSTAAVELVRVGGDVTVSANQGRIEGDGLTAATDRRHREPGPAHARLRRPRPSTSTAQANQGRRRHRAARRPRRLLRHRHRREPGHGERRGARPTRAATARSPSQANQGSVTIGYGAA